MADARGETSPHSYGDGLTKLSRRTTCAHTHSRLQYTPVHRSERPLVCGIIKILQTERIVMWGQKEEESLTKTATPATSQPVSPPDTAQAPASSTVVSPAADGDRSGRVQTQVGKTIKLKGEMTGSEDVYVDGEVEGTIELRDNALVVGPSGNVRAQVKARSITILGHLEGKVQAGERIEIRKTGSLEGDLVTPRIVIEDGAVFRGSIDISKPETNEKAPPRVNKQPRSRPPVVTAARSDRPPISTAGSTGNSGS